MTINDKERKEPTMMERRATFVQRAFAPRPNLYQITTTERETRPAVGKTDTKRRASATTRKGK